MKKVSKWDLFNWRCAITYSNFLQVILAPNFHSLWLKLWVQHLVVTNFDFLYLLKEKQDLNNEGIETSDFFFFDSYGKTVLKELCI